MPAGRAERIARRDDARPGRIAGVDRLLEPDIVAVVRSDVAHGRKACTEHVVRILDRGHAPEAVGEFQPAITADVGGAGRSAAHTSELQSLMSISYAVLC